MNRFENRDKNVVINSVVEDDNSVPLVNRNKMVLSLINIENETSKPFHNRTQNLHNGYFSNTNPTERFNLDMLITANYLDYLEALKFLNATITFFQVHASVSAKSFSFFPAAMQRLQFELVKMNFDKMFNLWSAMGAKYKPSMVYKIRLVSIQGEEVVAFEDAIQKTAQTVYPQ